MTCAQLASYFETIENISSRNRMTEILAELFSKTKSEEIAQVCYLLQGRVVPLYVPLEFGMAEKMVIKAIAQGVEKSIEEVTRVFKKEGDLGKTAEYLKKNTHNHEQTVSVSQMYEELYAIAKATGQGSQEEKIQKLAHLIGLLDAKTCRYVVRIPLGKMRLGFSDMTILDSLSWMITGSKALRVSIEKAYKVRPDLGHIATVVKKTQGKGVTQIHPAVGTPILMARADRLSSAADIIGKIGRCAIEYKYDGLRLQVHYKKEKDFVQMFSRNLEDVTVMFPDLVQGIIHAVHAKEVILEGEIVAYNPKTGAFIPFQETMQRKRKYDIEKVAKEIPVKLFAFELLFLNGKDYIHEPYAQRKKELAHILASNETIVYAKETIAATVPDIEKLFDASVAHGCEGIIAKRLDGVYQAGMRGWNWIKFKRAMSAALTDTFDVVVMGYTKGEGKRTQFGIGQFLTGVFDSKRGQFVTLTKIGTGLTDEQFHEFKKRCKSLEVKEKPKTYDVDTLLEADVWLTPGLVVEIAADEITRSKVHTAGRVMEPSKSGAALQVKEPGFAVRFPRLMRFRTDKGVHDSTTIAEIASMYKAQEKRR